MHSRVLQLTDGLANVGVSDAPSLVSMAKNGVAGRRVGTTTIGFGDDFDEELLTAMGEAGGGNAHHAASPEDAPAIFAKEFDDLVSLVAQNVSVEIRVSEHVQVLGILNEFPSIEVPGGVQVELGDACGDETRRVVFAMHVPSLPMLGPVAIGEVVLRYMTIGDQIEQHETRIPLNVNLVSSDEAAAAGPDTGVSEEVVILKSTRAQREARKRAQHGDFDGARGCLSEMAAELRSSAIGSTRAIELEQLADSLEEDVPFMQAAMYDPGTAKRMHYKQTASRERRIRPKE